MATTLAACELSGYSNSSQTFFWFSFSGKGFSSSLMKPSSSLYSFVVVNSFTCVKIKLLPKIGIKKREKKKEEEKNSIRNTFTEILRLNIQKNFGGDINDG